MVEFNTLVQIEVITPVMRHDHEPRRTQTAERVFAISAQSKSQAVCARSLALSFHSKASGRDRPPGILQKMDKNRLRPIRSFLLEVPNARKTWRFRVQHSLAQGWDERRVDVVIKLKPARLRLRQQPDMSALRGPSTF